MNPGPTAPIPPDPHELATGPTQVALAASERESVLDLVDRAHSISNLKIMGSPAFRLELSFEVYGNPSDTGSGKMEDVWLDPQHWRWSAQLGNYSQTRLNLDGSTYDQNTTDPMPLRLQMVRDAIFWPVAKRSGAVLVRTAQASWEGANVTCVLEAVGGLQQATPGRRWAESEWCIDSESGRLRIFSEVPGLYAVYDYKEPLNFSGHTLPRQVTVFENGSLVLRVRLERIRDANLQDSGAVTITEQMRTNGPRHTAEGQQPIRDGHAYSPPPGATNTDIQPIHLLGILGNDGRVSEVEALHAADPFLVQWAIATTKGMPPRSFGPLAAAQNREVIFYWEFSPATPGIEISASGVPLLRAARIPREVSLTGMYPLSAAIGAAFVRGHVLWTTDNGANWTDITPPGPANQGMQTIVFQDSTHAWAVFVDGSGLWSPQTQVRLVRTADGGRTWIPLKFDRALYPDLKDAAIMPRALQFIDAQHGWFEWQFPTSAAFNSGVLFSTSDGGVTWKELPDLPSAREFRFHTLLDGWIVGEATNELQVTHDGGKTWQAKSVAAPAICARCLPAYSVPRFQDANNAVLEVYYSDYDSVEGHYVRATYVTRDGGNSWENTETAEQNGKDFMKTVWTTSVSGNRVVHTYAARNGSDFEIRIGSSSIRPTFPTSLSLNGVPNLQFVDDLNGWMIAPTSTCAIARNPLRDGAGPPCVKVGSRQVDLLATTDGGRSFRVITPPPLPIR